VAVRVPGSLTFTQAGLNDCSANLAHATVHADIYGDGVDESAHTISSTG